VSPAQIPLVRYDSGELELREVSSTLDKRLDGLGRFQLNVGAT
jgi:hypothetical protein